jgi:DNA helicase-2/ATP-dependent DNA helicase PcrA
MREYSGAAASIVGARLAAYLDPGGDHANVVLSSEVSAVLDAFLKCDVGELSGYFKYVRRESPYSTQHGTKGAEFRKVIVVLDDDEGNYSLYSYEKLFGIALLSSADRKNLDAGVDSVIERTRRLLYVCVSRAVESLVIVLFASDVAAAEAALKESGLLDGGRLLAAADLGSQA